MMHNCNVISMTARKIYSIANKIFSQMPKQTDAHTKLFCKNKKLYFIASVKSSEKMVFNLVSECFYTTGY